MKIHFICRGNIYRSRLAEAYAKYFIGGDGNGIDISSSGIESYKAQDTDVSPVTLEYLKEDGLEPYLSPQRHQTTQTMLDQADTIVFMNDTVYEDAVKMLEVPEEKSKVWHIPDKPGVYTEIKKQVDELLNDIGVPEGN